MESTEQEVDDEDFHQDIAEVTDFVNSHRGQERLPEGNAGPGGECFSPNKLKHVEGCVCSHMPHALCWCHIPWFA